ncbi:MAG TPA: hypothetical protein K8V15_00700, partial [Tessaracoccus flavescens]|nr:hypothetical protein [Tessaracoccus flavescens]
MKSWLGWALRRARASVVLVATLFALVAVTSGILAFTLGNSGILATTAARDALLKASPGEGGVTAQTRMAPDVEAQDALAREKLTEGFAPAPVDIWTTYVSEPRRATDGPSQALILWAGEHLAGDPVRVTAGAWPSGPGEAALHVGAAEKAGIEPGARFTVDGHELTVTALWEPASPFDPLWFGEDLVLTGTTGAHLGPLVVDRSVLTGGAPFIRWGVVPDVETIAPSELNSLAEGAAKARELVKAADVTGRGIRADGDLAATAEVAARDYTVGQSFGFVPVSLLILVAVVGLVQVAGQLAATREREVSLLLARGASRRQLIVAGLGEATVAAVAGAAVGTAVAAAVVWLLAGNAAHLGTVLWGGLVSLALAIVCLGAVTVATTVRLARGDQPRSDRVRGVAGAAALVLVVAAAALATWQLLRAGTFVTTTDDGDIQADLLPALSPALLVAAAAVVGLVALAPVTRLLELASRRIRSTGLWLAGAQLARGLVVQAVPVVLTILAVGTATLASFYSGSYAEAQRQLASLSHGAPVRAILGNPPAGQPFALPPVAEVDG